VVVEPPRETRIARILEIHNGVLVAVEQRRIEGLGRPVRHPRVTKLRVRVNRARDKAAEEGSRGRPIKTVIVVQHAFEHVQTVENLSACLNSRKNATGGCAGGRRWSVGGRLVVCGARGAGVSPAMPVFLPAFPAERRHERRRGNLKGRSTGRSGAFLAPHSTNSGPAAPPPTVRTSSAAPRSWMLRPPR